jgi:Cu/Ag efflux pump CusA
MDRRRVSPDKEVAPRAWAGLAVVAAASFVATLDATVLYVAFGTIRRDFPDVSAAARLRPIVMTSFAFILGVLRLAIAQGAGAEMRFAERQPSPGEQHECWSSLATH